MYAIRSYYASQRFLFVLLNHLAEAKLGNSRYKNELEEFCRRELGKIDSYTQLLRCLIALWFKVSGGPMYGNILKPLADKAGRAGFNWLAGEAALLHKALEPKGEHPVAWAEQLFSEEGIVSLRNNFV